VTPQRSAGLPGDHASEAGAAIGSGDELDAGTAAGLLAEDDADRRRRIVAIAPDYAAPITEWLSGSAAAWAEVLAALTPAQRATIVATMRAYEAALGKHARPDPPQEVFRGLD